MLVVTGLPESGRSSVVAVVDAELPPLVVVVSPVVGSVVVTEDAEDEVRLSGMLKSLPITIFTVPGSRDFDAAVGNPPSMSAAWVASVSAPEPKYTTELDPSL